MIKATRRSLISGAAMSAVSTAAIALPTLATPDAELLALEEAINARYAAANGIDEDVVAPLYEGFAAIYCDASLSSAERSACARKYDEETGRASAINAQDKIFSEADVLTRRMWSLKAETNVGRAAKVRVLIRHIMLGDWEGPDADLDWDIELCRKLLIEFAGMGEADFEGGRS
jgi:hypothetical protein